MATAQSTVLRYPTKRVRPYKNPQIRLKELPANAVPLRPPAEPRQTDYMFALVTAMLSAVKVADPRAFGLVGVSLYNGAERYPEDQGIARAMEIFVAVRGDA